ncbi:hypothetical protein HY488_00885 [Candidatus Woesearchaeota archaeon]|nr:hypothetical protein [Candidatus Woesearchaeota archaeon]
MGKNILYVDNDRTFGEILRQWVRQHKREDFSYSHATSISTALSRLRSNGTNRVHAPDIVICSYDLPPARNTDSIMFLRAIHDAYVDPTNERQYMLITETVERQADAYQTVEQRGERDLVTRILVKRDLTLHGLDEVLNGSARYGIISKPAAQR